MLPITPRTYALKAIKQEYTRQSKRFGTVKGGVEAPSSCFFFTAATLFLIPFLLHISKSVALITNIYPNVFYSKELD